MPWALRTKKLDHEATMQSTAKSVTVYLDEVPLKERLRSPNCVTCVALY
jgi:hypothetical protein